MAALSGLRLTRRICRKSRRGWGRRMCCSRGPDRPLRETHKSHIISSMPARIIRTALLFALALSAYGQNSTADQIVRPADKTDAPVTLTLPEVPTKGATVTIDPLTDASGKRHSPQPAIDGLEVTADSAQFHIANIYF